MSRGVVFALTAYLLWGIFPIYFKQVQAVAPLEVLANRMLWSLVFVAVLLALFRRARSLRALRADGRALGWLALSALAVSVNWLIYIWAVANGRIVDASLGYFINPLLNVLIGAIVLGERPRAAHWAAVSLATVAVGWLTWSAAHVPWVGLSLASSFAAYGLLKKRASFGAIEGFAVETALLAPLAVAYLLWLSFTQQSAFADAAAHGDLELVGWLLLSGPVTAVPLVLFAAGAQRIPFATLGILQYIAPSLQLVIGIRLYGEPFDGAKLVGYGLIWIALAIFSIDGLLHWRAVRSRPAT